MTLRLTSMPNLSDGQTVAELPIAETADEILYFDKAAVFFGENEIVLGDALSRLRTASGFAPARLSTTVRNFRLRSVILDAETMLLLTDSRLIPETEYFVRDDRLIRCRDGEDYIIGCHLVH